MSLELWQSRLDHWLFDAENIVSKPLRWLLTALRYIYALAREVAREQLTLRAMSLVYTTLLSIVPLIAFSFSVLKGLGYHHDLEPVLFSFFEPLGDKAYELTARVMDFVDNVRGSVLGTIGLTFLLYTVISTVQKIEESFNFVWRVDQPRSLGRRFSEYLSVMVIGPVLIVSALGLLASLSSNRVVQMIQNIAPFGAVLVIIGKLMPYFIVAAVFTFLYTFIPNTKVKLRAALIGGVVAGVAWAASGAVFASFVAHSTSTVALYAGFAIVIFALMWLYLSWLILLLGAQLAFYVQHPELLWPDTHELPLTSSLRERLALCAMYAIGRDFCADQRRWRRSELAEHLQVPTTALSPVIDALETHHLIAVTEEEQLLPGRDPAHIELAEILMAVRNESKNTKSHKLRDVVVAEEVARKAEQALFESLKGRSLKDLVNEHLLARDRQRVEQQ